MAVAAAIGVGAPSDEVAVAAARRSAPVPGPSAKVKEEVALGEINSSIEKMSLEAVAAVPGPSNATANFNGARRDSGWTNSTETRHDSHLKSLSDEPAWPV